jgi:predicted HicB family RNase H-like nuclease
MCEEESIEPYKHYSGKFNLRIDPDLHEKISIKASAENKSLNKWVVDRLENESSAHN